MAKPPPRKIKKKVCQFCKEKATSVDYKDTVMPRVEAQSHFIRGLMLVTSLSPGALEIGRAHV